MVVDNISQNLILIQVVPPLENILKVTVKTLKVTVIFYKKAYNTGYSQVVTHPGTNPAQHHLTSVIRRELVLSRWYGCRQSTSKSYTN